MTDLIVDYWTKPEMHADDAIRSLGITYSHATYHPVGDYARYYGCENVPDQLPPWLTRAPKGGEG